MSDAQAGQVVTLQVFDIHDGTTVQNALLNEVMHSDMSPDRKVRVAMSIYEQRQKGGKLIVDARKAGISFPQEFVNALGVNGVMALPGATQKPESKS